jgi:hypothetical protein
MYTAIVDRCRGNRTTQGKEKLAELHHNEHEEKAKKLVSTKERKKERKGFLFIRIQAAGEPRGQPIETTQLRPSS